MGSCPEKINVIFSALLFQPLKSYFISQAEVLKPSRDNNKLALYLNYQRLVLDARVLVDVIGFHLTRVTNKVKMYFLILKPLL